MAAYGGPTKDPVLPRVVAGLAMAVLVAVFVVLYLPSGLVAPLWAVVGLWVLWAVLAVLGIIWFRRHPWWVVALPVLAVGLWFAAITAGGALLGWTA